jgi:hypothetical protein
MDPSTQEKGKELQEMLRLFKETTTSPLSTVILQTPCISIQLKPIVHLSKPHPLPNHQPSKGSQRQSPRLQSKLSKEKSVTRLAQALVVKKCGVLKNDQSLDDMTLHQYLQLYKQPLLEDSMQAIIKLTEVAVDKQNKKGKDKKVKKEKPKKKSKKMVNEDPPLDKKKAKLSKVAPVGAKV